MKISTAILATALCLFCSQGCHSQQTPASKGWNVDLSWNAPVAAGTWGGCTTAAPCVYAVWAETLAAGATQCDPASATAWKEITTASTRPSGTTFVDGSATGLNRCYAVHTLQAGSDSGPSNSIQLAVPGIPAPPLVQPGATTQQSQLNPDNLRPQPAKNGELASVSDLKGVFAHH